MASLVPTLTTGDSGTALRLPASLSFLLEHQSEPPYVEQLHRGDLKPTVPPENSVHYQPEEAAPGTSRS
jgi:hypothetical protein